MLDENAGKKEDEDDNAVQCAHPPEMAESVGKRCSMAREPMEWLRYPLPGCGVHVEDHRRLCIDFAVANRSESGLDCRTDHESEGLKEREEGGVVRPLPDRRHLRDVRACGGIDR